jgi:hypothetical protein
MMPAKLMAAAVPMDANAPAKPPYFLDEFLS